MKHIYGKVLDLFISVNKDPSRENKDEIIIDAQGIIEDKFYGKNIQRSILITSTASYYLAKKNGINMPYGSLGENIVIDVNPCHLLEGDKIHIGDTALEITQNCTLCKGLSKINEKLPQLLKEDRGIFAKTIKAGRIKKGDVVIFKPIK